MTLKAKLLAYDSLKPFVLTTDTHERVYPRAQCATCKWAEDIGSKDGTARCERFDSMSEGAQSFGGILIVQPDFGCVQWEGK